MAGICTDNVDLGSESHDDSSLSIERSSNTSISFQSEDVVISKAECRSYSLRTASSPCFSGTTHHQVTLAPMPLSLSLAKKLETGSVGHAPGSRHLCAAVLGPVRGEKRLRCWYFHSSTAGDLVQ